MPPRAWTAAVGALDLRQSARAASVHDLRTEDIMETEIVTLLVLSLLAVFLVVAAGGYYYINRDRLR
jgi:hypothetical protein